MQANRARFAAAGMLLSKLSGLVRDRVIANLFGVSALADVWGFALRAANNLQNLLGEQTLSAAFIPIYSKMLEEGREKDAGRLAGAVFGLLLAVVTALVLVCVVLAPWIVAILTPGLLQDARDVAAGLKEIDRYPLVVRAVRITFPMTGVLVLSAWALAILNGHRRFFLSYLAPVVWNGAIVATLLAAAWRSGFLWMPDAAEQGLVEYWLFAGLWGALLGGLLQFLVQLPLVLKLSRGLVPSLDRDVPGVRDTLRAVGPAIAGRGVVQLGFYIDVFLSSFLSAGSPGAVRYVAGLINLVMGVFGMSVAAAELPEMSREDVETDLAKAGPRIAERLDRAIRQSLFVVAPAVVGYLAFGFLVSALLFRGGRFGGVDNWLVYLVLCVYTAGLPASTVSRMTQNAFYALRDTATPARIAAIRLAVAAGVGAGLMVPLDRFTVADVVQLPEGTVQVLYLGALGLGIGSSLGAWVELLLLSRALRRRVPAFRLPWGYGLGRVFLALAVAVPPLALWAALAERSIFLQAALVLPSYMVAYLGYAWLRRLPELDLWLGRKRQ
ncbi:MAG: murein biosynthesis integral membrane protein MurJ [Thermoanaerobaculia bacterium]|nr:murein biosynthesis integral membrane protein MurJ [Thermoanaerobaculia bacterium]